jgi:hypothetical protein
MMLADKHNPPNPNNSDKTQRIAVFKSLQVDPPVQRQRSRYKKQKKTPWPRRPMHPGHQMVSGFKNKENEELKTKRTNND